MRWLLLPVLALTAFAASPASAAVTIDVNKDAQQMTVSVDGVRRYTWPISSGNPSHETPNGSFRTFRMEEDHYSKEFDDAPMPHSIFFTKQGHAIHGTDSVGKLGTPVSHGCVRISRQNAQTLWDLVKAEGLLNTTVNLTGSSRVALARNPKPRTNVARGDSDQPLAIAPDGGSYQNDQAYQDSQGYQDGYQNRTYQTRPRQPYYGSYASDDPRWPQQQQQRQLYPDPRGSGYIQDGSDPNAGYYYQRRAYPAQQYYQPGYYQRGYVD
ncbi:MAG: murein L,D-transpeptidase [Bradyrhizobiaceae bacterium]|nr:MAG: murein L,D-transpeptidase [Bradyrhizobiaceae bacterium]